MPAWNQLLDQFTKQADDQKAPWIDSELQDALNRVSQLRGDSNVLFYASSWLQKPTLSPFQFSITAEDLNGFMAVMYGMDWTKKLTLLIHTPGGETNATQTIVAYLRSKFPDVEVVVPTLAMSAGTMISLCASRLVMGRQSQLGPIDPQFVIAKSAIPAGAIIDQFEAAKSDILSNPGTAVAWAPVLQSLGPALLQSARNALDYGEGMVADWLEKYMFAGRRDGPALAKAAAAHFNDTGKHKSHGRRIDREEVRSLGLTVEDLEQDQDLQDAVLTAYHLVTILFEHGPCSKLLVGNNHRSWLKNVASAAGPGS